MEEEQKREKASHEALIKDNGRPCYPIEHGFDVFENPGQYKDILEYWQWGHDSFNKRLVFSAQLDQWKSFRNQQQHLRQYYVPRNRFHEFLEIVRDRRRKHGLDGDLQLHEEVAEQSPLDDWMEYQNCKLWQYEGLEQKLNDARERLASGRKALEEEGYPAFKDIEGLEFGKFFVINLEWGGKHAKAKKKEELAKRKLSVAKTRLEAAQSEELGGMVERDRWIDIFAKKLNSRQTQQDKLQCLVDKATRDMEQYDQWWEAKNKEWKKRGWDGWTDEGHRLIELETSSVGYRTKFDKMQELHKRFGEANTARNRAELELEFAEEVLEAARTEDLAPTVERAALIRRTQKEVRFAEFHVEEEKESRRVLNLKWGVLDELYSIPKLKGEMKRHNILLDWIEQQRRELVGDGANVEREIGPRWLTGVSSKAYPSLCATKAPSVNHPAQICAPPRKPSTTKSILDPVDPAKVTETLKQKRKGLQRTNVSRSILRAAEKMNSDSNTVEPQSDAAVPVEDGIRARLRSVRSSRVSKPTTKRPIGRQRDATRLSPPRDRHRRTGNDPLDMWTSSREVIDWSMHASMQKSTRGSKR